MGEKKFFPHQEPIQRPNESQMRGIEKEIFANPDNPKVVGARLIDKAAGVTPRSNREIKATFYLTKILHTLFPKNIPDIFGAYTDPRGFVREKVSLGRDHDFVENSKQSWWASSITDDADTFMHASENLAKARKELLPLLSQDVGGLSNEANSDLWTNHNYGRDSDGHPIYIEELRPWNSLSNVIWVEFDPDKLKKAVADSNVIAENKKMSVLRMVDRLEALYQEELSERAKKIESRAKDFENVV